MKGDALKATSASACDQKVTGSLPQTSPSLINITGVTLTPTAPVKLLISVHWCTRCECVDVCYQGATEKG